jgi:hypothetical protein
MIIARLVLASAVKITHMKKQHGNAGKEFNAALRVMNIRGEREREDSNRWKRSEATAN